MFSILVRFLLGLQLFGLVRLWPENCYSCWLRIFGHFCVGANKESNFIKINSFNIVLKVVWMKRNIGFEDKVDWVRKWIF